MSDMSESDDGAGGTADGLEAGRSEALERALLRAFTKALGCVLLASLWPVAAFNLCSSTG